METKKRVEDIVAKAPKSWYGTTYPNDKRFIGRAAFIDQVSRMMDAKEDCDVKTEDLENMFPEDYVRLGSPFSTIMEVQRAKETGFDPKNVFSFGSATLPLIAAMMTSKGGRVYLYTATKGKRILSAKMEKILTVTYGCSFRRCPGRPEKHDDGAVLLVSSAPVPLEKCEHVDAVVDFEGIIYVANPKNILVEDVKDSKGTMIAEGLHTIRKRLGAAPPVPDVVARLKNLPKESVPDTAALKKHLKSLAGCESAAGDVLIATVGLSALGACVMATLDKGDRDIDLLMCSTAYGGSSQQADILIKNCSSGSVRMQKHKFDIQGGRPVLDAVRSKLKDMRKGPKKKLTLVEIEYPTNPDMKDCDLDDLKIELESYRDDTGSEVVLILDTTFSPPSRAAQPFKNSLPVLIFTSLSKSVTGGKTTGGSLVANSHPVAQDILSRAHEHLTVFDTASKPCQLSILNEMHAKCEDRVKKANANTSEAARHMESAVAEASGQKMLVNFVTQEQIAKSVTPATFSFNLPVPRHLTNNSKACASLAQDFVDELVRRYSSGVKPCVSFGQSNTYVYATVPATSTQGVISEEDKAKQAVGGVQLVRFSFPPSMDMPRWKAAVEATLKSIYSPPSSWGNQYRLALIAIGLAVAGIGIARVYRSRR